MRIVGVVLVLGVFGIFGGGEILCDRGVKSEIGVIKTLNVLENDSPAIPVLCQFLDYFSPQESDNRVVLIKNDQTVISLLGKSLISNHQSLITEGYPVIVTGNYDSCSQTLTVNNQSAIEPYIK